MMSKLKRYTIDNGRLTESTGGYMCYADEVESTINELTEALKLISKVSEQAPRDHSIADLAKEALNKVINHE